jgi:hypothetical protein
LVVIEKRAEGRPSSGVARRQCAGVANEPVIEKRQLNYQGQK